MTWERLLAWIPPAGPVRGIVPLVPTWCEEQRRVGFWRIVPADAGVENLHGGIARGTVPERPLGTLLARELRHGGRLHRRGAAECAPVAVRYETPPPGIARKSLPVAAELALDCPGEDLVLRGLFRRTAQGDGRFVFDLRCVETKGDGPLATGIARAARRHGLRCLHPIDELLRR